MIELAAGRAAFPGSAESAQLNAAAKSIVSRSAVDALVAFGAEVARDAEAAYDTSVLARARATAARYVGGAAEQVALIPSTSVGLNVIADSIPILAGDNVVSTDLEFVSVVAPWQAKCQRCDAELRIVKTKEGRVDVADLAAQIDRRTRVVVLSSVVWTNGFRLDLTALAEAAHAKGALLVVDGIQQLGAMSFDVTQTPVDVLIAGGHKWLASPSAMGFLWASPGFTERHQPVAPYAPTMSIGGQDWGEAWSDPDFDPYRPYLPGPGASRFEVGVHHAALSAAGLTAALETLLDVGTDAITSHVLSLGTEAAEGLRALGMRVVTPMEPDHRSGLVVFDTGSAGQNVALTAHLRERGVVVSTRYTKGIGGVRVSCHLYNNSADLAALFDGIRSFAVS